MTARLTQASAPLMHAIEVLDEFGATRAASPFRPSAR